MVVNDESGELSGLEVSISENGEGLLAIIRVVTEEVGAGILVDGDHGAYAYREVP